jgi:hypothetical protein
VELHLLRVSVVCSTVLRNLFSLSSPDLAKTTNEVARKNLELTGSMMKAGKGRQFFPGIKRWK